MTKAEKDQKAKGAVGGDGGGLIPLGREPA